MDSCPILFHLIACAFTATSQDKQSPCALECMQVAPSRFICSPVQAQSLVNHQMPLSNIKKASSRVRPTSLQARPRGCILVNLYRNTETRLGNRFVRRRPGAKAPSLKVSTHEMPLSNIKKASSRLRPGTLQVQGLHGNRIHSKGSTARLERARMARRGRRGSKQWKREPGPCAQAQSLRP